MDFLAGALVWLLLVILPVAGMMGSIAYAIIRAPSGFVGSCAVLGYILVLLPLWYLGIIQLLQHLSSD